MMSKFAEFFNSEIDNAFAVFLVACVACEIRKVGSATHFFHRCCTFFSRASVDYYLCAFAQVRLGNGTANAACTACDLLQLFRQAFP